MSAEPGEDRPDKRGYLERLPLDSFAVESALNQIDTEFELERPTPVAQEESSQMADESTWLVRKQSRQVTIPEDELEISRSIGKYELLTLLGRGGFGEVWSAFDPNLKRHVALKIPRSDRQFTSESLQYFRSEAQKMATLERVPGIVPVYEAGEVDGRVYIVSYLVQGEDLGKIVKRGGLSYAESARIVAKVAETLHRAHLRNLFHRDVKLSNILIAGDGEIFLSDFGLCISEEEQLKEGHSTTGAFAYMAPEQVQGFSHRLDGRADIYALGVVLYRLLTDRFPYLADTPGEYLEQVMYREPRPPRSIKDDIPAELERICLKCLNKEIKDRYTTAADLARELEEWGSLRQEQTKKQGQMIWFVAFAAVLIGITIWSSARFFSPVRTSSIPGEIQSPPSPEILPEVTDPDSVSVEALQFPAGGADSIRQTLNSGRSLHVQSNGLSLLKLGETQEQVSFEVDISQLKWTGNIGVFYGYQEQIVEGYLEASYYVVEIVAIPTECLLVHSQKRHKIQNPSVVESDLLESYVIGRLETRTVDLKLRLSQDRKCEIFYNGKQVPWTQPILESQLNAIEVNGSYGVYSYVSSGTYHNLTINDELRNFQKIDE